MGMSESKQKVQNDKAAATLNASNSQNDGRNGAAAGPQDQDPNLDLKDDQDGKYITDNEEDENKENGERGGEEPGSVDR